MKRWPLNKAYFWETAPFFRILLALVAGILSYRYGWLPLPGSYALAVAGAALGLLAAVTFVWPAARLAAFALVTIMLLFMGNACAWYADVRNDAGWMGLKPAGGRYLVRISETPTLRPATYDSIWKVPVSVLGSESGQRIEGATGKAVLYFFNEKGAGRFSKGDTLLVPGEWERIKNAGNPFEFDYAAYCAQNGLYYRQFAAAEDIALYAAANPMARSRTERVHDWCMMQFDKYIGDVRTRGLIQAMMLGDEVNLNEEMRAAYAETGIVHIIAISGGNVAIFFIVISFLLWWLRDKRYLWIKYAIALPLVWFYVVMAGSSPSAIRAAVMFSLFAFAIMFQKNNSSLNGIFATAFLLLFAQPAWLYALGFQLSFAAVLSLILFYRHICRWWAPTGWIACQLWSVIAASIAAQVLVAPLIIYYFHSFPLMFIVANAAAYLFMGAVLVLSIVVIAVSWLPALASFTGVFLVFLVKLFDKIVAGLQHFSPSSFRMLLLTGVELIFVYIIIAGISTFLTRRQKPGLFVALSAGCLLLGSFCIGKWQRLSQDRLVVYNIAKENYVELQEGCRYKPLTGYNKYNTKADYAIRPAHINWQTATRDTAAANELLLIAGHKVLLLSREVAGDDHFPVDVLVINYIGRPDAKKLHRIFSPALVVIGNNYSRKQSRQWISAFAGINVAFHAVGRDGAYILQ